jgi:hypothetical protein
MSEPNGRPIDPTANVMALVAAAVQRIDDLRAAEIRRMDDVLRVHVDLTRQLSSAEAKRIDAIRSVDVGNIALANERGTQQAALLASQVAASAETLRTLVSTTATAMASQQAELTNQLTSRLALLEKAQYESKGNLWGWAAAAVMAIAALYGIFGKHIT